MQPEGCTTHPSSVDIQSSLCFRVILFLFHCESKSVSKSCLILDNPVDYSPSGSSVDGNSPDKNPEGGFHFLLQGISLTRGANLGLLQCRQILYHLSHQRSPKIFILLCRGFHMFNLKTHP